MWPKVLMQLFELLPHVSRLVPMAERYFSGRATVERHNEAALAAMADNVDGTMGKLASAHESLYRRLQEQDNQIATLGDEVRQLRSLTEVSTRRVEAVNDQTQSLALWLKVVAGMVAILIILVAILLLRSH